MLGIAPFTSSISALRESVIAKLVILLLTSFISALREALVATLVISGI